MGAIKGAPFCALGGRCLGRGRVPGMPEPTIADVLAEVRSLRTESNARLDIIDQRLTANAESMTAFGRVLTAIDRDIAALIRQSFNGE